MRFNPRNGDLLESPLTKELFRNDTFEITKIYLARPTALSSMKMSVWFCQAHNITDFSLVNAGSLGDFKQQLIDKDYVCLSLEPLKEFNSKWGKK